MSEKYIKEFNEYNSKYPMVTALSKDKSKSRIIVFLQCRSKEHTKYTDAEYGHMVLAVIHCEKSEYRGYYPVLNSIPKNILDSDQKVIIDYLSKNCVQAYIRDEVEYSERSLNDDTLKTRRWDLLPDNIIEQISKSINEDYRNKHKLRYAFYPESFQKNFKKNNVNNCVSWVVNKLRKPFTQEQIAKICPEIPPLVQDGRVSLMQKYFEGKEVELWK